MHHHAQHQNHQNAVANPDLGKIWNAADPQLKKQFDKTYRAAKDTRPVFEKFLPILGAKVMLDYLELHNPRCHGEAHDLGKALFAHTNNLGESLMVCGNHCTNACMHGVVGEAFGGSEFDEVVNKMTSFCAEGEMAALHKPGNCAHGIGHALMIVTDHNIPKALGGCEKFKEPGMGYYCATGVFMEYRGLLRARDAQGKTIRRDSVLYPCDTYIRYPAACYRYMLKRISNELRANQYRLINICMKLEGKQRSGCFHGLGAMYSRRVMDKPEMLKQLCLRGSEQDRIMCIEGVIEKFADFNEQRAIDLCHTLDGDNEKVCLAGAKAKMYRLDKPTMSLYQ